MWLSMLWPAGACNVPVFRYAIERWPASHYEAVVFHQGPLSAEGRAMVETLEKAGDEGFLNLSTTLADPDQAMGSNLKKLWQAQTNAVLPWLALYAPDWEPGVAPLWAGPLKTAPVKTLLDSPARRQVAQRLLKGESAVWLLLESGNKEEDDAIAKRLDTTLKELTNSLELPEAAPDDPRMRAALPLRIAFSVLRVSRQDPAEKGLVDNLLHGEEELAAKSTPIAFPIFGQGRALAALAEKALESEVITEACAFLCGACSCEVKELNPGKDLLLAADWESIFEAPFTIETENPPPASPPAVTPPPVPAAVKTPEPVEPAAHAAPAIPVPEAAAHPPSPTLEPIFSQRLLLIVAGVAALLVAITGSYAWISRQKGQPPGHIGH